MDYSFLGPAAAAVIIVALFLKFLAGVSKELISTLQNLTAANERVANATEKSAKEAAERNGHLAELSIDNQKATLEALDSIKKSIPPHTQIVEIKNKQ